MEMKATACPHLSREERKRVGEGEKSREAGEDGGNHGYKDGGQTEEQDDKVPGGRWITCRWCYDLGLGSTTDPPEEEFKRASSEKSWDKQLH